mmetsp:Transcript_19850/g.64137  ORF Transcript_19850/g.64137 Transcript_19850/m.64137 type:complete len:160 (-) Transcript_19850:56-535(-)
MEKGRPENAKAEMDRVVQDSVEWVDRSPDARKEKIELMQHQMEQCVKSVRDKAKKNLLQKTCSLFMDRDFCEESKAEMDQPVQEMLQWIQQSLDASTEHLMANDAWLEDAAHAIREKALRTQSRGRRPRSSARRRRWRTGTKARRSRPWRRSTRKRGNV